MTEIEALREQVKSLVEIVENLTATNTEQSKTTLLDDARTLAIYSMVGDLAAKLGVERDQFVRHYMLRFRWWHDRLLLDIENESYAAQLDQRTLKQADVPETFPSIFERLPDNPTELE